MDPGATRLYDPAGQERTSDAPPPNYVEPPRSSACHGSRSGGRRQTAPLVHATSLNKHRYNDEDEDEDDANVHEVVASIGRMHCMGVNSAVLLKRQQMILTICHSMPNQTVEASSQTGFIAFEQDTCAKEAELRSNRVADEYRAAISLPIPAIGVSLRASTFMHSNKCIS